MCWTETGTIQGVSLVHIFHTLPVLPLMIPWHTTHYAAMESAGFIFSSSPAEEREREKEENYNWKMGRREDGGVSERDDPILESGH